ncbi:MAG: hypothetical protein GC137_10520 [Alphaproteobacteria bacterium]|nr:hypothetical protein [Alphaproteobacteria bacterium]
MPVQNPDYNPDWEALHDHHAAERDRIAEKIAANRKKEGELFLAGHRYDTPEMNALHEDYVRLSEEQDQHSKVCQRCLDTYQHKTIQDGAAYLFRNFDTNVLGSGVKVGHQIDFEKFTTMDEVFRAWSEANDATKQITSETTHAMPSGRPDGLDIFEDIGTNKIYGARQLFGHHELDSLPHKHGAGEGCDVLVTIDQRDGEYHICFTQSNEMWREGGLAVQREIERLATAAFNRFRLQEAMQKAQEKKPLIVSAANAVKGLLTKACNAVAFRKTPDVDPRQFHFYIHHPPADLQREKFLTVTMGFESREFHSPEFQQHDVVPATIQKAYKDMRYAPANAEVSEQKALPAPKLENEG